MPECPVGDSSLQVASPVILPSSMRDCCSLSYVVLEHVLLAPTLAALEKGSLDREMWTVVASWQSRARS